jgi:hypothetical protein
MSSMKGNTAHWPSIFNERHSLRLCDIICDKICEGDAEPGSVTSSFTETHHQSRNSPVYHHKRPLFLSSETWIFELVESTDFGSKHHLNCPIRATAQAFLGH